MSEKKTKKIIKVEEPIVPEWTEVDDAKEEKHGVEHPSPLCSPPRLVASSFKYFDAYRGLALLPTSGAAYFGSLNLVSMGGGYDQRLSVEIRPVSLEFRWIIMPTASAAEYARIVLVYDSQSDFTLANPGDYLDNTFVGSNFWSYQNFGQYGKRFKVLLDWQSDELTINAGPGSGPYLGHKPNIGRVKVPLPKGKIRYLGAAAGYPAKGNIICYCCGLALTGNTFQFGYCSRFIFEDG
jgi:hypothetical protein